jgi:Protein of unknown function (DUF4065)
MPGNKSYDAQRLRELVVYIARKCLSDARFGKTKLNKILFFADFGAFRTLGQSITGAEYWNLPEGPVPHQLLVAVGELGPDVYWESEQAGTFVQQRLMARRAASIDLFSGPEIALVDAVIDDLWSMTAKQVSDYSHETMAWRLSRTKQQIPYGTALLSSDEPTDEDVAWLEGVAANGSLVN